MEQRLASDRPDLLPLVKEILYERGIKGCTMDLVAERAGMSKRTLYEIFESKESMIEHAIARMCENFRTIIMQLFRESGNRMEAMARYIFIMQKEMQRVSPDFIRDLNRHQRLNENYEENRALMQAELERTFARGVEEGVFRADVNYTVMLHLLELQMQSLSCMQELFPPEITVAQAYQSISIGFLRSIASPSGMLLLDRLMRDAGISLTS